MDVQGPLLACKSSGQPGSNYVTTINRRDLVPPDPAKKPIHRAPTHGQFRTANSRNQSHAGRTAAEPTSSLVNRHAAGEAAGSQHSRNLTLERHMQRSRKVLKANGFRSGVRTGTDAARVKLGKSARDGGIGSSQGR
jgi:hypothetical protein